jgi:hypothetical protein
MSNMSMNSEKTAPLMALRRFSCLSAVSATNPEDSVAVIGGSPKILVAAAGFAFSIEASDLAIDQTEVETGKSVIPLDGLSERWRRPPHPEGGH